MMLFRRRPKVVELRLEKIMDSSVGTSDRQGSPMFASCVIEDQKIDGHFNLACVKGKQIFMEREEGQSELLPYEAPFFMRIRKFCLDRTSYLYALYPRVRKALVLGNDSSTQEDSLDILFPGKMSVSLVFSGIFARRESKDQIYMVQIEGSNVVTYSAQDLIT